MAGDVRVRVTADVSNLRQGMDAASNAVKGVQQNMGRAQGAANLLGGAIETLGGTSGATGKALGAMLGGFAGGGLIGLAIGGVSALVGAMRSASEAAEKATGEWKKHIEALDKGTEGLRDKLLALKGMDPELHKMQVELVALQRAMPKGEDIADPAAFAAAKARYNELLGRIRERQAAIKAVADEEKRQADAKEAAKAAEKAEAEKTKAAQDGAAERKRIRLEEAKAADLIARQHVEDALQEERDWAEGLALIEKQKAARAAAAAKDAAKDQAAASRDVTAASNRSTEEQVANAQAVGSAVGSAVAGLVSGQQSMGDVVAQVASQSLSAILDMVTKSIMAKSLDAGAGAASATSSIPVVGPVLAIGAMAAMVAAVQGLLGSMPGRAFGGPITGGRDYMVGEHGPERIRLSNGMSGTVFPSGSGGSPTNITIQALDGASVERTLLRNQRAFRRVLRRTR